MSSKAPKSPPPARRPKPAKAEKQEFEIDVVVDNDTSHKGSRKKRVGDDDDQTDVYRKYGRKSRASILMRRRSSGHMIDEVQPHVFSVRHEDTKEELSSWFIENADADGDEVFFQVQVTRPTGASSVLGEGTLVWFSDGSSVDLKRDPKPSHWQARCLEFQESNAATALICLVVLLDVLVVSSLEDRGTKRNFMIGFSGFFIFEILLRIYCYHRTAGHFKGFFSSDLFRVLDFLLVLVDVLLLLVEFTLGGVKNGGVVSLLRAGRLARNAKWLRALRAWRSLRFIRRIIGDDMVDERKPYISLYHESEDNIIAHGHRLNGEEIRHFQSLEGRVAFAEKLMGNPGSNLPTPEEPLFIPACDCVLKFSTPGGTGSKFVFNACYTGETPILFSTSWNRRFFRWACNLITYITKLAICVTSDNWQLMAFAIFLLVAGVLALDEAIEQYEEDVEKREEQRHLMYDRDAWLQLLRNTVCAVCRTKFFRKKSSKAGDSATSCRKSIAHKMSNAFHKARLERKRLRLSIQSKPQQQQRRGFDGENVDHERVQDESDKVYRRNSSRAAAAITVDEHNNAPALGWQKVESETAPGTFFYHNYMAEGEEDDDNDEDAPSSSDVLERNGRGSKVWKRLWDPEEAAAVDDERRLAEDGNHYTHAEFFEHYGGTMEWEAADPNLRRIAADGNAYTRARFIDHHGGTALEAHVEVEVVHHGETTEEGGTGGEDERRLASDGNAYTLSEFVGHFGGTKEWDAAACWSQIGEV